MTTRAEVIHEFLKDPLLIQKGYLKVGEATLVNLHKTSPSKMVELIKTIINSKFNQDNDNKTTRDVNLLLNSKA
jgi:hypothetical protein